jgi:hypothetical protein
MLIESHSFEKSQLTIYPNWKPGINFISRALWVVKSSGFAIAPQSTDTTTIRSGSRFGRSFGGSDRKAARGGSAAQKSVAKRREFAGTLRSHLAE